tara:strand:- start:251 stop:520 length:270 start_codon:yes stop_codon:yes gene_type:complete
MRKNKRTNFTKPKDFSTRITVTAEECRGDAERMVRRFCKKVKKSGIIEEVRDRRYFKKDSVVNTERKRAKKRLIEKVNKRERDLLKARR